MKMPLYLLDYGMDFIYKKETYTYIDAMNGVILARDKFGLDVEFNPCTAVKVK